MGDSTYAIPNFLGGELSDLAQGRFDKPDYRTSLNICLNAFPIEIGAWTRRPGTMHASHTRKGYPGRTMKFDFEQASAVTLEFTEGFLRFRSGATLLGTNDTIEVHDISTSTPAVVQVIDDISWATDDTVIFPGASAPLLEGRQFLITMIDATHFSIVDPVTGTVIDGSTIGPLVSGATVMRVQQIETVYVAGTWADVRAVQAETTDLLLSSAYPAQALTVTTLPEDGVDPQFNIEPAIFNDGPYLDPFTNGVRATPVALSGIINLILSFAAYDATAAYAKGSFVTSAGIDYISLLDQNTGNTPASHPTYWSPTSASDAINDGQGFLGSDTGRLVRLFSEPDLWSLATPYTAGKVVTYNPSGEPGAATYWQSLTTNTNKSPGSDITNWQIIPQGAAIWTWGRITGLSNVIDRNLAGSLSIGDMTLFNGITAPFDGNFSKPISSAAGLNLTSSGFAPPDTVLSLTGFVGKNYSGAGAQSIKQATIYPSVDSGFGFGDLTIGGVSSRQFALYTLNLRASNSAPTSSSSGTLLGSSSFSGSSAATTIISSDQVSTWNYVWVELTMTVVVSDAGGGATAWSLYIDVAQISFFSPTSTASGTAGCSVEILGPPLLYTAPVLTWRLGVYSNTTGWPTCGTYHEGRLWLGGAIANRFDACKSNGIVGGTIDFAPTNQYGAVAANNALSYTLNSDGVNPMFWMKPDLQGVVIGTQQGEWLVQAPSTGPIAPTNIAARRMTKHGSQNVEPARTEHANLFVKRYGRKLMEYFADAYSGKFSAPNLADKAAHIVSAGITEVAYAEAETPIVWGRDADNALFGMTYRRTALATAQPPDFYGWHRQELGSGRTVESLCVGPSVGGELDALTMVTNDSTSAIRHVEILTDTPDENAALADAWFLDNAVEPTSRSGNPTPVTGAPYGGITLNGLWHLNGETVQVFASGVDCGDRGNGPAEFTDFLVTNGSCFVPYGDSISAGCGRGLFTAEFAATARIVVGFTYNSDGQTARPIAPADTGARNGPSLGKTRRNHQFTALVGNTLGVSFGSTFSNLRPAQFRKANGNEIDPLTSYSGVHHDSIDDDYSYDGMLAWRISRPWPANIIAISGNLQTQDR